MAEVTSASEKITLAHEQSINGKKFPAGIPIEVSKEQAVDLKRSDAAYTNQLLNLHKKNVFERNLGSMAAGGGEG